jgi:hypothetical protein
MEHLNSDDGTVNSECAKISNEFEGLGLFDFYMPNTSTWSVTVDVPFNACNGLISSERSAVLTASASANGPAT